MEIKLQAYSILQFSLFLLILKRKKENARLQDWVFKWPFNDDKYQLIKPHFQKPHHKTLPSTISKHCDYHQNDLIPQVDKCVQ